MIIGASKNSLKQYHQYIGNSKKATESIFGILFEFKNECLMIIQIISLFIICYYHNCNQLLYWVQSLVIDNSHCYVIMISNYIIQLENFFSYKFSYVYITKTSE